jgi:gluconokinase
MPGGLREAYRMDVVIGLDTGTTSTKAVAAGLDGEVRAMAGAGYPLLVPGSGRAELDPECLRTAAVEALREVAGQVRERGDTVLAVCLSAAMHGLVPLGADGRPLGPLITWADGRAAAQSTALVADGRGKALQARTGTPVHPMSPLAKLAWWRDEDAGLLRAAARWGGVKDVVAAALCGPAVPLDLSSASTTGLYDIHARRWDAEALDIAGLTVGQLPEVVPTTHRLPPLLPEVVSATGLPAGVPVIVGAADGPLANLGLGAVAPGVAAVSVGTSGALRTVVDGPRADDAGRLFCFALTEDMWVLGGAVNNGGSVVRWAAQAFSAGSSLHGEQADDLDAELLAEAAEVAAGSDGLLCLPYLLGERAPWWRAGLRGAYLGLRREHRRAHLVRAAVEGVCQQLALVGEGLAAAGVELTDVRATGGAVESPLWVATLAATLDHPVRTTASPEGTAVGACLLGLHALGALPDLAAAADIVRIGEPVTPEPGDAALYRRLRPLVERSALAIADVLTDLDKLAPGRVPATEKAVEAAG